MIFLGAQKVVNVISGVKRYSLFYHYYPDVTMDPSVSKSSENHASQKLYLLLYDFIEEMELENIEFTDYANEINALYYNFYQ